MNKSNYINRELSWLSFNERVLQEAQDKTNPLLERVKFLGIFSNNRDEFFRVRVASLKRISGLGKEAVKNYGDNPELILKQVQAIVLDQQKEFDRTYNQIIKELADENIHIINEKQLNVEQKKFVANYFINEIQPMVFPILLDVSKPFPELKDKSGYLVCKLETLFDSELINNNKSVYALIEIPSDKTSRFVKLPSVGSKRYIILLDDVIRFNLKSIFNMVGYHAQEAFNIKLTRDAELDIDADIHKNIVEQLSTSLKKRKKGSPVRLVYDSKIPKDLIAFILRKLAFNKNSNPIPGGRYHNFKDFLSFPNLGMPNLEHKSLANIPHPQLSKAVTGGIMPILQRTDVLLHFPYHNFNYIVNLLREASIHPDVQYIKITLYRLAHASNIAQSLINAVKNGKKVTVVVELKARFDEEHNIYWANKMQEEGIRVIYGVPGLKVHSKIFLISKKIKGKEVLFSHVGTGNMNEKTSKIYTDMSLLTSDIRITGEVKQIFEYYENNLKTGKYKHLAVAPFFMRSTFEQLIKNEVTNAKANKPAAITLKLNNLVDRKMIDLLIDAAKMGVHITLLVRGICSLNPYNKKLKGSIKITSIVDRFLEHNRVLIFNNNGKPKVYISSADWMSRNLDHRSEVAVPIYDEKIKKQIIDTLQILLEDNTKARILDEEQNNNYVKAARGAKKIKSQTQIFSYLQKQ